MDSTTWDYEPLFQGFHDLMPHRVREILLVSSLYDTFVLDQDGLLAERILGEYLELNLSNPPRVTQVSTPEKALRRMAARPFDLVVTVNRQVDARAFAFGREVRRRHPGLQVVMLAHDRPGLMGLIEGLDRRGVDEVFVWSGDTHVLVSAIKVIEDRRNVDHDVRLGNVRVILVIEDSPRDYSTLLPLLYTEVIRQVQQRLKEGFNEMHRLLRMRARPKILLAKTYEAAMDLFRLYRENVLGIVSDVRFPRAGAIDPRAGLDLLARLRGEAPTLPILFYSAEAQNAAEVEAAGASFIHKNSRSFVQELRSFILNNFGFGDFIFRTEDGREVSRVATPMEFPEAIRRVPVASVVYHASHNHFSNWFMAHGEFELAERIRPVGVEDFPEPGQLREFLATTSQTSQRHQQRGGIADFARWRMDPECAFARLGLGSVGGKARSIAFIGTLLAQTRLEHRYPGVVVGIPRTVALGTDVFDRYMDQNDLHGFVASSPPDAQINTRFVASRLPDGLRGDLAAIVDRSRFPLAVRSSSLLEDSWDIALAGLYDTYMLPNNHPDPQVRLDQLCQALSLVYAATYHAAPRACLERSSIRMDREKMGVVVQELVGSAHGGRFYPDISGTAQSYNFYPIAHMKAEDGIAHVALGLGRTVVRGGQALHFCPGHPKVVPQLFTTKEALGGTQREFFALDLARNRLDLQGDEEQTLLQLPLEVAEADGTLAPLASVLCPEDGVLREGLDRPGARLITFESILKWESFPLAQILHDFLATTVRALGTPVEVEFAANLPRPSGEPARFCFLQVRPYNVELERLDRPVAPQDPGRVLCESHQALGHGIRTDIRDVVYVRPDRFDPRRTQEIASEVGEVNGRLAALGRPYLLVGPGRWGSRDPWLGIPVSWEQISGAAAIVEANVLGDFSVEPSQGTHFFHNITASRVAYLTVGRHEAHGRLDWAWLEAQPTGEGGWEAPFVRHLDLQGPIEVRIDGRKRHGVILRPRRGLAAGTVT